MEISLGTRIVRLTPSTTGRAIMPGDVGIVGGINPESHSQPTDEWSDFAYFPVQWLRTGLWSSMAPEDYLFQWCFLPTNVQQTAFINVATLPPTEEEE